MADNAQEVLDYIDRIAEEFQKYQPDLSRLVEIEVKYEGMKQLENPEILIGSYSSAVQRYNDVCSLASKIAFQQYNLKIARRVVSESALPASFQDRLRRRIDSMLQEYQYMKESAYELRNAYDAGTRFYSSVQYILSSPRLGGYGA